MHRFQQTPFLAFLVFGVGIGLGLAWKTGWIPVEFANANTGSLADPADPLDSLTLEPSDVMCAASDAPPEDLELIAGQTEPAPNMPVQDRRIADPPAINPRDKGSDPLPAGGFRPHHRVSPLDPRADRADSGAALVQPVRSATGSVRREAPAPIPDDEQAWAAEPTANRARHVIAADVPPGIKDIVRAKPGEIQLAANQEPAPRELEKTVEPSPPGSDELAAIDEQIAGGQTLAAHRALSKLYWNNRALRDDVLPRLQQTSRTIFFEPRPHFVDPYVVEANDQLRVIAGKYQLSWEYLARLNRTDPRRIQLGQKLKVMKGPFAAVVDLGDFALTIHLQGYFVKRYPVGIGKDDASPLGKFTVLNKVENPQYTGPDGKVISADDPANPLGERWIDLGESYGIHGTIEPESIGRAASRGCIRMREKDVIEVYDFLVKGSEVVIRK